MNAFLFLGLRLSCFPLLVLLPMMLFSDEDKVPPIPRVVFGAVPGMFVGIMSWSLAAIFDSITILLLIYAMFWLSLWAAVAGAILALIEPAWEWLGREW